jgi:hypothetical protein
MPEEKKDNEKVTMSFYVDAALAAKLLEEAAAERRSTSQQFNVVLSERYDTKRKTR